MILLAAALLFDGTIEDPQRDLRGDEIGRRLPAVRTARAESTVR